MYLKSIIYIMVKIVNFIYDEQSKYKDYGLWVLIGFANLYLFIFIIDPMDDLLGGHLDALYEVNKNYERALFAVLFLIEAIYLFWDDRIEKIYEDFSSIKPERRRKILKRTGYTIALYTILAVIYMYHNFSYGRW